MGISRSLIFIPGNNQRFLDKSKTINSDIVCFDLEDSVPFEEKENARNLVSKTIHDIGRSDASNEKIVVSVRINAPDSELAMDDLKKIILDGIDAIVIPKVETDYQIANISNIVKTLEKENNIPNGFIKLIPSIESALGVVNAYSIAKSDPRVSSLVFGIFDFLHNMKIDSNDDDILTGYLYGRAKVPVDARAAGVDSIDSIWQNIGDMDGLERDLVFGKKLGYTGKCIIHPSQINLAHRVFAPSQQDIQWAKKVISILDEFAYEKTGRTTETTKIGAVNLEGKMIDAVHYKQAKRILESVNQ
ncbi:MAG: CoA ester lyase [Nitrosopumilus sp.]|nr:CoA ester lyase [Nitrosopumilus sp.]